jgi:hypothetical protein
MSWVLLVLDMTMAQPKWVYQESFDVRETCLMAMAHLKTPSDSKHSDCSFRGTECPVKVTCASESIAIELMRGK